MFIFYGIPVFLIVIIVLGVLGVGLQMDLFPIIKWLTIIGGIIGIFFGICFLDSWNKTEKVFSIITIVFSLAFIILVIVLDIIGVSFNLLDILEWVS